MLAPDGSHFRLRSVCRERENYGKKNFVGICLMATRLPWSLETREPKKIRLFVLQEDTRMKQYMTIIFYVFLSGVQCMHEVFY